MIPKKVSANSVVDNTENVKLDNVNDNEREEKDVKFL